MASPPILDFETLLAPIAAPDPAGKPLPFEVKEDLDEKRKEVSLSQFDAKDPRRPEQPQSADWSGIEQLAKDTLATTSKDLLVAARLTEALVKQYGFRGLRDSLQLMRRLALECWDRIYPVAQAENPDGELDAEALAQQTLAATIEVRAAPFNWLDDELRGARFPFTIRMVPLTRVGKEPDYTAQLGWQHWKEAQDARGAVTAAAFDQAVAGTPREYCQSVADDIAASVVELTELTNALTAKMGEGAPTLSQMRRALSECNELAKKILERKGPAPVAAPVKAAPAAGNENETATQSVAASVVRPLTRDDLLSRLADASALLLQMEPHSPIAYLVQRAVKLARLPLPELMRVLVRNGEVLGQLDRDLDLGIEKQDAANKEAAKAGKGK